MTDPAVIKGTFSDYKLIKTRKVIQIIVEVPVEQQAQVFAALGYPMPDSEAWVAVARLDLEKINVNLEKADKPKRPFPEWPLSQQAGMRCEDYGFWQFLSKTQRGNPLNIEEAACIVRVACGIDSRAQLDDEERPRGIWLRLNAEYEQWAGLATEERQ